MRRQAALLLSAVLLVGPAACSEPVTDPTDRTWQLTELDGSPPLEGSVIDLTLTDDAVSGSAGCNTYNGPATFAEGSMTLGPDFALTFMACEQPIMDQEQEYLAALTRVSSYELGPDELALLDAEGIVVATFD